MTLIVQCPSGLELLAHPIGGEELITIIDRAKPGADAFDSITAVLASCFEQVIEPGPYRFLEPESTARPSFARVLQGDILVAILRLRIASFPKLKGLYEFDFPCSYSECGHLTPWELDLAELLGNEKLYRSLSPDAFMRVHEGTPFSYKTSDGQTIYYQLDTPSLAKPLRDLMTRERRKKTTDVEQVARQLVRVDGLRTQKTNEPVTDLRGLWQWAKRQTAGTLDEVLEAYEASDCGVDTEIRVRCEECGKEQDINLPFGKTFFRPRASTKKVTTAKDDSGEASSRESMKASGATSSEQSAGKPTAAADTASPS